jgi:hypothetical protein
LKPKVKNGGFSETEFQVSLRKRPPGDKEYGVDSPVESSSHVDPVGNKELSHIQVDPGSGQPTCPGISLESSLMTR